MHYMLINLVYGILIYVGISFINLILGKSIIIITVTFFLDVNLNNIVGNYKGYFLYDMFKYTTTREYRIFCIRSILLN